ncbi:MAG TPA: sugar phosphate isomerase/epimerase [Clostridia bacterium]|nr:sugar phosphate isomerase/epimerase [Clostridia bacterium]
MRFGICRSYEVAELAKKNGFDYLECNLQDVAKMSQQEIKEMQKKFEDVGIAYESTNCFFPGEIKIVGDEVDPDIFKEYTKRALYNAEQLGIETSVIGSGKSRMRPDGFSTEKANEQLLQSLYSMGEIAKEHSICVVIEPLNKGETNTINTVSQAHEFCKKLSHPNIKVLADIYHFHVEKEDVKSIIDCADDLKHVHFANPVERCWPRLEDEYDFTPFANALKQIGYNGRISIEAGTQNIEKDIAPAFEVLNKLFR